jgi:hypothetical protein
MTLLLTKFRCKDFMCAEDEIQHRCKKQKRSTNNDDEVEHNENNSGGGTETRVLDSNATKALVPFSCDVKDCKLRDIEKTRAFQHLDAFAYGSTRYARAIARKSSSPFLG